MLNHRTAFVALLFSIFTFTAFPTYAASGGAFEQTTLLLVVILMVAKWVGFVFKKLGLPELVGELLAGVILGNLSLIGIKFDIAAEMQSSEFIQYASELGVVLLLFLVGLESNLKDLLRVGVNSFSVALIGVILPVLLGVAVASGVGMSSGIGSWFIGATLAATSVGITAKILGDAGLIRVPSAQVILGAAVIDDVLGILILAVLAGVVMTGSVSFIDLSLILIKAIVFFVGALWLGTKLMPRFISISDINTSTGFWTAFALWLALVFAQVASFAGLAPIIGSFVAGLILEDIHFSSTKRMTIHNLEELLKPITDFLLPIFFVGIGTQVKLDVLTNFTDVGIIILLLVVAIAGKVAAGWGAFQGKGFDKLGIGIGMVPRGEVGLIFASYALKNKVLSQSAYSILVFVVIITTVLGPIMLKPRLKLLGKAEV